MTNPTQDDRVRRSLRELTAAGVPYLVLRGFRPIEELETSVDIDLFVARSALPTFEAVAARSGWRRRENQVGRFPHHFFDAWDAPAGVVRSLDVVTELCYGDLLHTLSNSERLFDASVVEDGIRIPTPWPGALTLALHVVLDKGSLSAANARRVAQSRIACDRDSRGRVQLERDFGGDAPRFVDEFFSQVGRAGEGADLRSLRPLATRLRVLRARPLLARWDQLRRRWRQWRRPVVRIAVIGIDGSGKSTIVTRLSEAPSTVRFGTGYLGSNHYRTTPARWLNLKLVRRREAGRDAGLAYRILANLDALWLPFELMARMVIAEHRSEVVLYDRYPLGQDDGAPTTKWGRVMLSYTRVMRRLLPSPDLVILLDGDDRVIWERKREFPFELHQRTQAGYRELIRARDGQAAVVRTDGAIEAAVEAVRAAIAQCAAVRRKLYAIQPASTSTGITDSRGPSIKR